MENRKSATQTRPAFFVFFFHPYPELLSNFTPLCSSWAKASVWVFITCKIEPFSVPISACRSGSNVIPNIFKRESLFFFVLSIRASLPGKSTHQRHVEGARVSSLTAMEMKSKAVNQFGQQLKAALEIWVWRCCIICLTLGICFFFFCICRYEGHVG